MHYCTEHVSTVPPCNPPNITLLLSAHCAAALQPVAYTHQASRTAPPHSARIPKSLMRAAGDPRPCSRHPRPCLLRSRDAQAFMRSTMICTARAQQLHQQSRKDQLCRPHYIVLPGAHRLASQTKHHNYTTPGHREDSHLQVLWRGKVW